MEHPAEPQPQKGTNEGGRTPEPAAPHEQNPKGDSPQEHRGHRAGGAASETVELEPATRRTAPMEDPQPWEGGTERSVEEEEKLARPKAEGDEEGTAEPSDAPRRSAATERGAVERPPRSNEETSGETACLGQVG